MLPYKSEICNMAPAKQWLTNQLSGYRVWYLKTDNMEPHQLMRY